MFLLALVVAALARVPCTCNGANASLEDGNESAENDEARLVDRNISLADRLAELRPGWPSLDPEYLLRSVLDSCVDPDVTGHPFSYWVSTVWGRRHEEELARLSSLGVGAQRVFRCFTRWPSNELMTSLWMLGLGLMASFSQDFFSAHRRECYAGRYGCYDAARAATRRLLRSELVTYLGRYHQAFEGFTLFLRPDVLVQEACEAEGDACGTPETLRVVLSAWDGVLDAEYEEGVPGRPFLTSTFSAAAAGVVYAGDGSGDAQQCAELRHPLACAGDSLLRKLWLAVHGGYDVRFQPHNLLNESFAGRWRHSFEAGALGQVPAALRDYARFVHPAAVEPSLVLEYNES